MQRIYREERPTVRRRGGRKRAIRHGRPIETPLLPKQRWSLDFVSDQLTDGRRFRILTVIDNCTRECLALAADTSLSGRVARELDNIIAWRGRPGMIVSDNGTELRTARLVLRPIQLADAAAIQRLFPLWEIVRHTQAPWPYPENGALGFCRDVLAAAARGENWTWSLRLMAAPDASKAVSSRVDILSCCFCINRVVLPGLVKLPGAMAEAFDATMLSADKAQRYAELTVEIAAVLAGEPNRVARMASVAAMLAQAFSPRFFWTGFYVVDGPAELVVGPYQGTLGCLRIAFGRGVCGTAAAERRTVVVPDVEAFPGHIACDARSRSEIVAPVFDAAGALIAVLDVDSTELAGFDEADAAGLELILRQSFS